MKRLVDILLGYILEKRMEFDERKIEAKRILLGQHWQVAEALHAITTAEFKGAGNLNFNPAQGILVKVFINSLDGEMKFYPAILFKKDE